MVNPPMPESNMPMGALLVMGPCYMPSLVFTKSVTSSPPLYTVAPVLMSKMYVKLGFGQPLRWHCERAQSWARGAAAPFGPNRFESWLQTLANPRPIAAITPFCWRMASGHVAALAW